MRLLVLNYEYPPLGGGGGVTCRNTATALAKRHEVHVLTSQGPGLSPREVIDGVHVWRAPIFGRSQRAVASIVSMLLYHPAAKKLGAELCREHAFDLVASWFAAPSGVPGRALARQFDLPHAVLMMGGDVYDPTKWYAAQSNPLLGRLVGSILQSADLRIAPSTDIAVRARELHGVTEPIEVVPFGVDPEPFAPCSRAELGMAEDAVHVVSCARLVRRKNFATLVAAIAEVDDPLVHLTLLGDGPERDNLAAQAKQLGIADRVHFAGFISGERKHQYLAASDMFVLASEHEGFGLVYLEAMHVGLPVIAAKIGGQTDFLVEGETGMLIDGGQVQPLKAAIRRLAGDPELRRRLGARNVEIAKGLDIAASALRYERLFMATIAASRFAGASAAASSNGAVT